MTQNDDVKDVAHQVLKKCNINDDQKFGSIIAILMMVSIILTLIRVLQECNKEKTENMTSSDKNMVYGESIRTFSTKRGIFTRMRIKRILKKELSSEDFSKYSLKMINAILDTGENISDSQVSSLVEAANV
jgi:hypothetical protein